MLSFTVPTVVIQAPGYYVLDRNWNVLGLSLKISGSNVTVDLRGYSLGSGNPTIEITGDSVTVRNGTVIGTSGVSTSGTSTLLDGLQVAGDVKLGGQMVNPVGDTVAVGGFSTLRDSTVSCAGCPAVFIYAPGMSVEHNKLSGDGAIFVSTWWDINGDSPHLGSITDNEIECEPELITQCVTLNGIGNFFARNRLINRHSFFLFLHAPGSPPPPMILLSGDRYQVVDNQVMMNGIGQLTLLQVDGSLNLIRGTTVSRSGAWEHGIVFGAGQDNAYGGNYVQGSIETGAMTPIDLGGNVVF